MKLTVRLGLALAVTALSPLASAHAADYDPPIYVDQAPEYTPVEVGSGWYLRGDIGFALTKPYKHVQDFVGLSNFDEKRSQLLGSVGVGYHLNDYLRTELNFGILPSNKFSDTQLVANGCNGHTNVVLSANPLVIQPVATTQDCQVGSYGENKGYSAMANAYVDLGTYSGLTPYIGGGIGLAYNKYTLAEGRKNCKEVAPNSSGAGGFACDDPAGYDGQVESESKLNFAYSLGAGLSYRLSQNVSMDVGYEYFAVPSAKYVTYDNGVFNVAKGVDYHAVKVGLRYDLW
ncbi:outer membrane beta-barrel protein [Mesorhizobium sp. SP-1A]|uniref:outer membrane beta-barrel protein n=1 Tax=Mesorhizobium sp. SP-1A TaxID=3077840 RepID=UPI0028F7335A|nr:outer membrane beta-barrel protein [Mesorhizobium sp. SP-1A]